MTAQIQDKLFYNGERYSISGGRNIIDFNPREFDMSPTMLSTACWSGYWCEYEISDGRLFLKNLYIHNAGDFYPPFYGVEVAEEEFTEAEVYSNGKSEIRMMPKYGGARVYKDVHLLLDANGTLTIGKGFDHRYYRHMGYQVDWSYETVYELFFEKGKLISVTDKSEWAAAQREEQDLSDPDRSAETANRLLDKIDERIGSVEGAEARCELDELIASAERVQRGLEKARSATISGFESIISFFDDKDEERARAQREQRLEAFAEVGARVEETLQRLRQMLQQA